MNIFDLVIIQPVFNLLMGLYAVVPGRDFGVAVILFTILIRFALYPLTRSMLHQTKAMRKLQPKLAAIKKAANGDRQKVGRDSMELYKQHGVNPFRSIGILLIQIPIFIALYRVIQIFTMERDRIAQFTYDFLEPIKPIQALIQNPDSFNEKLFNLIDLTKTAFDGGLSGIFIVLLAAIAGYTQFIMSKQTMPQTPSKRRLRDIMADAAEGKQADQDEMNAIVMARMSKVLPFVMFAVTLGFPGAIALYYAVSNIVAVAQQSYLLKQDEEELEEIADEVQPDKPQKKPSRKKQTTPKKKAEATVVKIVAKDSKKRRK